VEVNRKTGGLRATTFCHRPRLRPDHQSRRRPEPDRSNVVQTVSRTLKNRSSIDRVRASTGWYPILHVPEIPTVDIELVDRPTDKPWGAASRRLRRPAAIANAVSTRSACAAIGALTPAKVLAPSGGS